MSYIHLIFGKTMTILKITNDYSYLLTKNGELKHKLWEKLRFRQRNYFMNPLYKQHLWDGYYDFFDKKTGKFLSGLVTEIKLAMHYLEEKYEIVDERTPVNLVHTEINDQFMNDRLPEGVKPITLHDYQVDLVNQALKYHRGIVENPTGSGKTFIMLAIMKALHPGTPILFLANRKGIVRQNYLQMLEWGFKNVGMFNGDVHKPNLITCANVQSLHHLYNVLPKFKALIVDECHMMMNATAIKAYKKLTGCSVRIAVSATPFKFEQKKKNKTEIVCGDNVHKYGLKGYFGPVFKTRQGRLTTEMLQDRGILSPSKCYFYPITEPENINFDIYQDAVTNGIAQNWHFHQVVQKLCTTLKGRTLILVDRLAHGDTLAKMIPGALWVQGKDDDETRDYVIKALTESKGNVVAIATQQIFSAAINIFIHNLINAAGGKAEHDIIQRMGRGLRTINDKEILTYYDFIFKTNGYLEEHSRKRVRILKEEGHEIIIKDNLDFM